jgi:hypothetical protein
MTQPHFSPRWPIQSPFTYFGGKSRIASAVWDRLGRVGQYVEPFAGSLAVLMRRPLPDGVEIVNDLDALVANFWRSVRSRPGAVARAASYPVIEIDCHAEHDAQQRRKPRLARMLADPHWCDAGLAGRWVWGMGCTIGDKWQVVNPLRSIPRVVGSGNGVHRKSLQAGPIDGRVRFSEASIRAWMRQLADRLRYVRVCCGDWSRVLRESVLAEEGLTAVFLDPPYGVADRADVYGQESRTVSAAVREWAIAHGGRPNLRIALCGYEGEHAMPPDWSVLAWSAPGGYGNMRKSAVGNANRHRERIWFSPHCLPASRAGASTSVSPRSGCPCRPCPPRQRPARRLDRPA